MNKQELIDSVVESCKGKLPPEYHPDDNIYSVTHELFTCEDSVMQKCTNENPTHIYSKRVCTVQEFIQRAKEFGWVNGYKWGVEYTADNKKPELPDDLLVRYWLNEISSYIGNVGTLNWVKSKRFLPVVKFKIIDENYKPVNVPSVESQTETSITNELCNIKIIEDWYDYRQQKSITETPPYDTECEFFDSKLIGWKKCKYIGINSHGTNRLAVIFDSETREYLNFKLCDELKFRPLDHDTRMKDLVEKNFVDLVTDLLYTHCCATKGELRDGAKAMFKLGFKLPENLGTKGNSE